ncbi:DUF4136 domain-containing protein [Carboxylicivirga sp. RSCT41]|uniref:DUF4136 domain-containing protein n=1 Tax=Carboxylicivirga agarovorans TaxID=3417570 RepID=UPI003D3464DE
MKKIIGLFAVIAFLASCSSTKVTTDQARNANFSSFSTFEVVYQTGTNGSQINALNVQRVEEAIQYESQIRGLKQAEEAELIIVWGVGLETQRNYTTNTNYYAPGRYGVRGRYGGYGMASSTSDSQEYTTTNGKLQIAVVDRETEEVLWIGTAQDQIKGNSKKAEKKINEVIAKVFEEFPISKYRS